MVICAKKWQLDKLLEWWLRLPHLLVSCFKCYRLAFFTLLSLTNGWLVPTKLQLQQSGRVAHKFLFVEFGYGCCDLTGQCRNPCTCDEAWNHPCPFQMQMGRAAIQKEMSDMESNENRCNKHECKWCNTHSHNMFWFAHGSDPDTLKSRTASLCECVMKCANVKLHEGASIVRMWICAIWQIAQNNMVIGCMAWRLLEVRCLLLTTDRGKV